MVSLLPWVMCVLPVGDPNCSRRSVGVCLQDLQGCNWLESHTVMSMMLQDDLPNHVCPARMLQSCQQGIVLCACLHHCP